MVGEKIAQCTMLRSGTLLPRSSSSAKVSQAMVFMRGTCRLAQLFASSQGWKSSWFISEQTWPYLRSAVPPRLNSMQLPVEFFFPRRRCP
jgi:hypothetical protein